MKAMDLRKRPAPKTRRNHETPFVLGVGLPRTGSFSLKLALEQLLDTKCYHMIEICGPEFITKRNDHVQFWRDCQAGKHQASDMVRFLVSNGYRAATDLPINCYWKEIYDAVPNIKVILTYRDPETWWDSLCGTINNPDNRKLFAFPYSIPLAFSGYKYYLDMAENCKDSIGVGFQDHKTPEEAKEFYQDWVKDVKSTVLPEELLIFRASDGWRPLCQFLEVPVPDTPYPRSNSRDDLANVFKKWLSYMRFLLTCFLLWAALLIGVLVFFFRPYVY